MNPIPQALVVDDNRLNSRLAEVFLQKLGWGTRVVNGGLPALDALREQEFDLVLLDLRMPGLSGEDVCRAIRHELHQTRVPVVAYTAHSMPEERDRILARGFSGLLIKPITFADMREVCDEVLDGRLPA